MSSRHWVLWGIRVLLVVSDPVFVKARNPLKVDQPLSCLSLLTLRGFSSCFPPFPSHFLFSGNKPPNGTRCLQVPNGWSGYTISFRNTSFTGTSTSLPYPIPILNLVILMVPHRLRLPSSVFFISVFSTLLYRIYRTLDLSSKGPCPVQTPLFRNPYAAIRPIRYLSTFVVVCTDFTFLTPSPEPCSYLIT